ncbi:uncharacterized protein LOC124380973 isoform X1 [Silurus meridionalis]|uniref:uncharacterized protein LOC124380973 isoform X1 n=1 Tax=Silurus meridionalis TaxID=175797 RepID=UPI001EEB1CBC|nr:uncharacterized protein LOC124380973 isoform X1 [Silurus meridionalis]
MGSFVNLPVFLCVMGLLSETLCSFTLEVEVEKSVTIWCQHELTYRGSIFWFKHTTDSVPLLLGCKKFRTSAPSQNCYFSNDSERLVMFVQHENTSLTITALNVSDTGLYYCSTMESEQVIFRNSTYLHVRGVNKTVSENKVTGCDCSTVIVVLSSVFGLMVLILLSVLIFILLKHRKTHSAAEEVNGVAHSDSVIYTTLHYPNEKTTRTRRHDGTMKPCVIYSSVA